MTHRASIGRALASPPVAAADCTRAHRAATTTAMALRKGALTVEQTTALIENIKNCACIWNPDHEEKVHRGKIASAWADIAQRMNLPEDLIRAKWKNLRDLFMREVKKLNLTSVDDYHGKWKHFKTLWFLYREDSGERAASEDDASNTPDVFDQTHEPYMVKIESPDAEIGDFMFLSTEQESEILPEKRKRLEINDKCDRDEFSDLFTQASKRRRTNQTYTEEDCDVMFLMSLTPYLKLLKPISKLLVRNKIQETILKEIERSPVDGHL